MCVEGDDDRSGPQRASMFCLTCDYVLDGLRSPACPECGRKFDPEDITSYRQCIVFDDPVRLARLPIGEAALLVARLEASAIVAVLHEERGGVIGYAELPKGSVWVERADHDRAREVMLVPQKEGEHGPWRCSRCGEHIEGQFAMCWNCGADRGE